MWLTIVLVEDLLCRRMKRVNLKLSIRVGKKRRGKRLLNNFRTLNSQLQVANKMLTIKIPYSSVRFLSKTKARPKDKGPNTNTSFVEI